MGRWTIGSTVSGTFTRCQSLFITTELHHCEGTPIRGSLADHNHNPRDPEDNDNSGGPTPEEIGMMYLNLTTRIKCAEVTTENSFSAGSKLLKEVRKYMLKYQIPDKTVVNALFRTFNRDKLQRTTSPQTNNAL
jgi:hypothetical protein